MAEVRVRVLGAFEVEGSDARAFGSRKARMLLKLLAVARGSVVSTDRLAEVLWPRDLPAKPGEQIAVLVSRLRNVLGAERLARTDGGYRLLADWIDLVALDDLVTDATRAFDSGRYVAAITGAEAAIALLRGRLLEDEPETWWFEVEQRQVARLESQARRVAANAALQAGRPRVACDLAAAALEHDGYDEEALRVLMRAHLACGRPGSALAAYVELRDRLAEDLGMSPSTATEAVHDEVVLDDGRHLVEPHTIPTAALVGRDDELAMLDAELTRASDGTRVVAVRGEPGIGKTALLDTWSARAMRRGVVVLGARGDEFARHVPLRALIDAVDDHLASRPDGTNPDVVADWSALRALVDASTAGSSITTGADLERSAIVVYDALHHLLAKLGAGKPVAVVLDDAHLAGDATAAWLRYIAHRPAGRPLLVIAAMRGELLLDAEADATTIELGPLTEVDVAALVGAERARHLYARSDGHPLLLTELAAVGDDVELPASLSDAVERRVRQLGAAAATVSTAAVLGAVADLDLLATVLRCSAGDALAHLEEGVRHGLVEEHELTFVFRHALVRDALAQSVGASRRALLHRDAAHALAARATPDPLAVAHHARLGGDRATAARQLVAAAEIAAKRYDGVEAARLYSDSIDVEDNAAARRGRGQLHLAAGRLDEADADADTALRLDGGAPALELAAWIAYYRRDLDTARLMAERGAAAAVDGPIRASCLALSARVFHTMGDLASADKRFEQARHDSTASERNLVDVWLGALRVHQGRPRDALPLVNTTLRVLTPADHPFALLHAHLARAHAYGQLGQVDAALGALDDFDAEAARGDSARFAGRADNYRAWLLRNVGAAARADELNERALDAAAAIGFKEAQGHALLDLADGRLRERDVAAAIALLDRLDDLGLTNYDHSWRHRLRGKLLRGRVAIATGSDAAAEIARDLVADAAASGAARYVELGRVLALRAGAGLTPPSPERLADVASLEGWWLLAELARVTGDGQWQVAAETVASRVAAAAGRCARDFDAYAAQVFNERARRA